MLNQNFEFAKAPWWGESEPSVCSMVYSLSSLFVSNELCSYDMDCGT